MYDGSRPPHASALHFLTDVVHRFRLFIFITLFVSCYNIHYMTIVYKHNNRVSYFDPIFVWNFYSDPVTVVYSWNKSQIPYIILRLIHIDLRNYKTNVEIQ